MSLLFLMFSAFLAMGQSTESTISEEGTLEIISQAVGHQSLWQGVPTTAQQLAQYTILHHGTDFWLPVRPAINGTPVKIIEKNEIQLLGGKPYFMVHTFNVQDNRALVRIYLVYGATGAERNNEVELEFFKNAQGQWVADNTSN